jgi:voltage-gated potassium channel
MGSIPLWYSIVTITTVGDGGRYRVTPGGRITAAFIMSMGVGIIGAPAGFLSSVLAGSPPAAAEEEPPAAAPAPAVEAEIATLKNELAAMRE